MVTKPFSSSGNVLESIFVIESIFQDEPESPIKSEDVYVDNYSESAGLFCSLG